MSIYSVLHKQPGEFPPPQGRTRGGNCFWPKMPKDLVIVPLCESVCIFSTVSSLWCRVSSRSRSFCTYFAQVCVRVCFGSTPSLLQPTSECERPCRTWEQWKCDVSRCVCTRKRGVLQGAVRKITSCSPLPFGAPFARRSTPQCLQLAGTTTILCFDEAFRASKSAVWNPKNSTFPSVLLRREPTWRVTRAPAGQALESFVFQSKRCGACVVCYDFGRSPSAKPLEKQASVQRAWAIKLWGTSRVLKTELPKIQPYWGFGWKL